MRLVAMSSEYFMIPENYIDFSLRKKRVQKKSVTLENSTLGCDTLWTLYQCWLNS